MSNENTEKRVPAIRFKGFTNAWEQRTLGEVFEYEQPQDYLISSTDYSDDFATPVLTAGQTFILGYTDETTGIKYASPEHPVIIFDDFTTSSHFVDFPFKVKSSAIKLLTLRNNNDNFYVAFHALTNTRYVPTNHERHWIATFANFPSHLPSSVQEQHKVGQLLHTLNLSITLHQRACLSFFSCAAALHECNVSWRLHHMLLCFHDNTLH